MDTLTDGRMDERTMDGWMDFLVTSLDGASLFLLVVLFLGRRGRVCRCSVHVDIRVWGVVVVVVAVVRVLA